MRGKKHTKELIKALEEAGYPAVFEDGTGEADGDIDGTEAAITY